MPDVYLYRADYTTTYPDVASADDVLLLDPSTLTPLVIRQVYDSTIVTDACVVCWPVTVSDACTVSLLLQPIVSDSLTIVDTPTFNLLLQPTVFDDVAIAESVTVVFGAVTGAFTLSINDAVTLADSPTVQVVMTCTGSDAISLTESMTLAVPLQPVLADSVSLDDSLLMDLLVQPRPIELITVAEAVIVLTPVLLTTVNDAASLTEALVMNLLVQLQPTESVTLDDIATVAPTLVPNQVDSITVDELVAVNWLLLIDQFDAITLAESTTVVLILVLQVSTDDTVTLTDTPTFAFFESTLNSSATDDILVTDSAAISTTQPPLQVNVYESLTAVAGRLSGITNIT